MRFLRWVSLRESVSHNPAGASCGGGAEWVCLNIESGRDCRSPRLHGPVGCTFSRLPGLVGRGFFALYNS
jgi:hypothetical protein